MSQSEKESARVIIHVCLSRWRGQRKEMEEEIVVHMSVYVCAHLLKSAAADQEFTVMTTDDW